jgi:hypothetical protein
MVFSALYVMQRPRQAMLEYREVWRATGARSVVTEVIKRTTDAELRRLALPSPELARDLALLCEQLAREQRSAAARECFDDVVALPDAGDGHRRRVIELALAAGDLAAARDGLLRVSTPFDGEDAVLSARLLLASEGIAAALTTTSTWIVAMTDARPLLEWRLQQQRAAGFYDDAEATLVLLRPLARSPAQAAGVDLAIVEIRQQRGDPDGALAALRQPLVSRPRDVALLALKLKLELATHRLVDAVQTLRTLRLVAPEDRRTLEAEKLVSSSSSSSAP